MNYKIYLMRHAYSEHNSQKQQWKKRSKNPNFKLTADYHQLKYKKSLIDPSILSKNIGNPLKLFPMDRIQLIICSPLRRCLQTCSLLIKNSSSKIKVIVQPLLSSRLSSAWSIGSDINQLKAQFSQFDFSAFQGKEANWMNQFFDNFKTVQNQNVYNSQNIKNNSQIWLQLLKQNKGQNYFQFKDRVQKLKINLKRVIEGFRPQNSQNNHILIISHSCVLNFLLSRQFDEKGKVKKKQGFEHCVAKQFQSNDVIKGGQKSIKAKL